MINDFIKKYFKISKNNRGFTMLLAIITTSILLLISFVVVNVALKQLILSNISEQTQYAFYNAESGVECALYWDIKNGTDSAFATTTAGSVSCNNQTITTNSQTDLPAPTTNSLIGGGGSANPTSIFKLNFTKGCVVVSVTKNASPYTTTISSRGYNTCVAGAQRKFERGITLTY